MKGLMVPLLFFVTTGMVVGQQSPPPGSFDPGNQVARPQPDDDGNETNTKTSGPQQFGQQETVPANQLRQWLKQVDVFEVNLDAVSLEALRQGKELTAGFSPQDSAGNQLSKDSIRAITARSESVPSALADPIPVQGQVILDEKSNKRIIAFPLTEIQVEGLATGQFVFQIPEQELGSYDVVALVPTFDPNTSAPVDFQSQGNRQDLNQRAGSVRGLGGNDIGGNGFQAPVTDPSIFDRRDTNNNVASLNSRSRLNQLGGRSSQSSIDENNFSNSSVRGSGNLGFPTQGNSFGANQATGNTLPPLQRLTNTDNEKMLLEMKQLKQDLYDFSAQQQQSDRVQQQKQRALMDEIDRLKNQNYELSRRQSLASTDRGNLEASQVGYEREARRPSLDAATNVDLSNRSPNQTQRPTTEQTNNRIAADVGEAFKTQTTPTARNGNEGVIFVLFLFSLAGNLYLGILCRSLYARYGVLADELRETFSGSM